MDNIGPLVIFILYMAISAWAKRKKAQAGMAGEDKSEKRSMGKQPSESSPLVGSILEQIKQELFAEEPIVIPAVEPDIPEDILVEDEEPIPFEEGSNLHRHEHVMEVTSTTGSSTSENKTLGEILEPYSIAQQGIILHEIFGKPRAYQKNEEWFHSG